MEELKHHPCNTSMKSLTAVSHNGWPCSHLGSPLFGQKRVLGFVSRNITWYLSAHDMRMCCRPHRDMKAVYRHPHAPNTSSTAVGCNEWQFFHHSSPYLVRTTGRVPDLAQAKTTINTRAIQWHIDMHCRPHRAM